MSGTNRNDTRGIFDTLIGSVFEIFIFIFKLTLFIASFGFVDLFNQKKIEKVGSSEIKLNKELTKTYETIHSLTTTEKVDKVFTYYYISPKAEEKIKTKIKKIVKNKFPKKLPINTRKNLRENIYLFFSDIKLFSNTDLDISTIENNISILLSDQNPKKNPKLSLLKEVYRCCQERGYALRFHDVQEMFEYKNINPKYWRAVIALINSKRLIVENELLHKKQEIVGIPNVWGTCYFNTALKLIFNVYEKNFKRIKKGRANAPKKGSLSYELWMFYKRMENEEGFTISILRARIKKIFKLCEYEFSSMTGGDEKKLFDCIMNKIKKEGQLRKGVYQIGCEQDEDTLHALKREDSKYLKMAARNEELIILNRELQQVQNLYFSTEENSRGLPKMVFETKEMPRYVTINGIYYYLKSFSVIERSVINTFFKSSNVWYTLGRKYSNSDVKAVTKHVRNANGSITETASTMKELKKYFSQRQVDNPYFAKRDGIIYRVDKNGNVIEQFSQQEEAIMSASHVFMVNASDAGYFTINDSEVDFLPSKKVEKMTTSAEQLIYAPISKKKMKKIEEKIRDFKDKLNDFSDKGTANVRGKSFMYF